MLDTGSKKSPARGVRLFQRACSSNDFRNVIVGVEVVPEAHHALDGGFKSGCVARGASAGYGDVEVQEVVERVWALDNNVEALRDDDGVRRIVIRVRDEKLSNGLAGFAVIKRTKVVAEVVFWGDLAEHFIAGAIVKQVEVAVNPDPRLGGKWLQHDPEVIVD